MRNGQLLERKEMNKYADLFDTSMGFIEGHKKKSIMEDLLEILNDLTKKKSKADIKDSKTSPKTAVKMQENNRRLVIFREGMIYNSKDDVPAGETAFRISRGKNAGKFGSRSKGAKGLVIKKGKAKGEKAAPKAEVKKDDNLETKAKKYKTADEFVKSQVGKNTERKVNKIKINKNYVTELPEDEKKIIQHYTGALYKDSNRILNGRESEVYEDYVKAYSENEGFPIKDAEKKAAKVITETKDKIKKLDDIISEAPKFSKPIEVFRGVSAFSLPSDIEVGGVIDMKSFPSTTSSLAVARGFAKDTKYSKNKILKIKTSEGLMVEGISHYEEEKEILLPRNRKYKITEIKGKTISLEILPEEKSNDN